MRRIPSEFVAPGPADGRAAADLKRKPEPDDDEEDEEGDEEDDEKGENAGNADGYSE